MRVQHLTELDADARTRLMQRSTADVQRVMPQVQAIMEAVQQRGDDALREYTARFDGVNLPDFDFRVSADEIAAAYEQVDTALVDSLKQARDNLTRFHREQLPSQEMHDLQPGVQAGRMWRPIERVGLYAPGGKAVYPSTVLMLGTPALVADCPQRVLCVPPSPDGTLPPAILVAADVVGLKDIFKLGGGARRLRPWRLARRRCPMSIKFSAPATFMWWQQKFGPRARACPWPSIARPVRRRSSSLPMKRRNRRLWPPISCLKPNMAKIPPSFYSPLPNGSPMRLTPRLRRKSRIYPEPASSVRRLITMV